MAVKRTPEPLSHATIVRSALETFASVVTRPFVDCGDAIFVEKVPWLYEHRNTGEDLTAIEIRVNQFHVRSFTKGAVSEKSRGRSTLMKLGRAAITAWAHQLRIFIGDRSVLFFLGGKDEVILRFHLERTGRPNWTDLEDRDFLRRWRLEVYRVTASSLERIA